MNKRSSIALSQRACRKRRQGKRGYHITEESPSTEAENIIEVDESGSSTRRQMIESPDLTLMASSPSIRTLTGRYAWRNGDTGSEQCDTFIFHLAIY